jgi:hypothetical protein
MVSFILNIGSIVLITAGLIGKDWIPVVLYGPVAVLCIGLFMQIVMVEYKHQLSQSIDSMILDKLSIGENEVRKFSHLFTIILILFGCAMILLSIDAISKSNTGYFAVLLFGSSLFLGIAFGRVWAESKNMKNPGTGTTGEWNKIVKEGELESLKGFLLKQDSDSKSRPYHQKILAEQSESFAKEMLKLCQDEADIFHPFLESNFFEESGRSFIDNIDRFILKEEFANSRVQKEWFREAIGKFDLSTKQGQKCYEVLTAYVMFDSLKVLTKQLYSNKSPNSKAALIAGRILTLLGNVATILEPENLFLSGTNSHRLPQSNDSYNFLFTLGCSAIEENEKNENSDGSPWWLINVKIRLDNMMSSPHWSSLGELPVKSYGGGSKSSHAYYVTNTFMSICGLLTDTNQHSNFSDDLLVKHITANLSPEQTPPKQFFTDLDECLIRRGETTTDTLITMAWILLKSLKENQ